MARRSDIGQMRLDSRLVRERTWRHGSGSISPSPHRHLTTIHSKKGLPLAVDGKAQRTAHHLLHLATKRARGHCPIHLHPTVIRHVAPHAEEPLPAPKRRGPVSIGGASLDVTRHEDLTFLRASGAPRTSRDQEQNNYVAELDK